MHRKFILIKDLGKSKNIKDFLFFPKLHLPPEAIISEKIQNSMPFGTQTGKCLLLFLHLTTQNAGFATPRYRRLFEKEGILFPPKIIKMKAIESLGRK